MDAALTRLRALDPRVQIGAAVGVLVILVAILVIALSPKASTTPVAAATPGVEASATQPRVRSTPVGTAAPRPATFVTIAASVPVSPPPAPRSSPTPEPGLWRLEGYIVDEQGKPIENVCVVIGPVPCAQYAPHTDERGHYFVDIAAAGSQTVLLAYDFYFEIPGRQTVWLRMTPTGATTFNAVLKRT
jgi:murein DD-endopeptidase MepM/ murein hydrolase activator NlpD